MRSVAKLVASGTALLLATTVFAAPGDEAKTLNEATTVLSELRNTPENGIPDGIWSRANCVVVIPGLKKAGFIVGGEFGEGAMSCKNGNQWSAPIFMKMTKGSAGLQAGVQSVDVVLVVLNRSGAEKLLSNKVTLGADASIAAGPVGRTASAATDAQLTAEILSYSRAKGLFAGINLSGGSLRPDESENERAYGKGASPREIALGTRAVTMSAEARAFTTALARETVGTTGVK